MNEQRPEELIIERIFNAPRVLVWKVWTEKEHALQWGGPSDYPIVHIEGELRPGGKWRACLRAKDGGEEMWQGGIYREIVPPERLVYTFAWAEESGNSPMETLITLTFADEADGKTKMTFTKRRLSRPRAATVIAKAGTAVLIDSIITSEKIPTRSFKRAREESYERGESRLD